MPVTEIACKLGDVAHDRADQGQSRIRFSRGEVFLLQGPFLSGHLLSSLPEPTRGARLGTSSALSTMIWQGTRSGVKWHYNRAALPFVSLPWPRRQAAFLSL